MEVAFAVAIFALTSAAVGYLTYAAGERRHDLLRAELQALKKTAPSALAAEVAELSEAVGKLAESQRRFQGRIDARWKAEQAPPKNETAEEVRARLRAEHGLPTLGKPTNGA